MRLCKWVANDTKLLMKSENFLNSLFAATSKLCNLGIAFAKLILPDNHTLTHFSACMGSHHQENLKFT